MSFSAIQWPFVKWLEALEKQCKPILMVVGPVSSVIVAIFLCQVAVECVAYYLR